MTQDILLMSSRNLKCHSSFFFKAVLQYYLFGTIKPSEQKMKKDDIV